jgi:hypothetical protein
VQWYIHAYQSVTDLDLSADMADVRQAGQVRARAAARRGSWPSSGGPAGQLQVATALDMLTALEGHLDSVPRRPPT